MKTLLQRLKNPKNKIRFVLLAGVVLFMQCYLLQHKVEHQDHYHFDSNAYEIEQDCQLCLGAQQANQFIFSVIHNLSLSLVEIFIFFLYQFFTVATLNFSLPQPRAPPIFSY